MRCTRHHVPTWFRRGLVIPLATGVVAGGLIFPRAGAFLVAEDAFDHAEVALVLSGAPIQRTLSACDLYRDGRIDQIVVIPEPPTQAQLEYELVRLNLLDPELPPWSERILVASGIPRSQIRFLPEPIDGTIGEALSAQAFFADHPPTRLVVITSPSASRRARFIFRQVFGRTPVRILSYPSRYDSFHTARWWVNPRNALTVVMEYQKFLANALALMLGRGDARPHPQQSLRESSKNSLESRNECYGCVTIA